METINHLNEQLHECQQQYTDLLNQTEIKRELTCMTEDKEKLECTCRELQVQYEQEF
jgi:hypothetical protein